MDTRFRHVGIGLIFCLGAGTSAHAAVSSGTLEWKYVDTSTTKTDFNPLGMLADDRGFWLSGFANGLGAVARYDNASNLLFVVEPGPDYNEEAETLAAATADGGFLTMTQTGGEQTGPFCVVSRHKPNGVRLWTQNVGASCHFLGTDAAGGSWIDSLYGLHRIAPDGVIVREANGIGSSVGAVDPQTSNLYAALPAVPAGNGSAAIAASIALFDVKGVSKTLWEATDDSIQIGFLTLGSDGNLYGFGTKAGGLYALSVTKEGALRWQNSYAGSPPTTYAGLADGSMVALDQNETLYEVGSDGSLRFTKSLGSTVNCACDQLKTTRNGDVVALLHNQTTQLVRIDANGDWVGKALPIDAAAAGGLATLADGSALAGPFFGADDGSPGFFEHADREGNSLASPQLRQIVYADPVFAGGSVQAADGTLYVLTHANSSYEPVFGAGDQWISKISPNGQLVWKQRYSNHALSPPLLGVDRLCGIARVYKAIECISTATGDVLWTYTTGGDSTVGAMALLDDNAVVAIVNDGPALKSAHVLLNANGVELHHIDLGHSVFGDNYGISSEGTLVVSDLQYGGNVSAWDKSGAKLYTIPTPLAGQIQLDGSVTVADDGSALLVPIFGKDANSSTTYLWSISPHGQTRWLQDQGQQTEPGVKKIANGIAYVISNTFDSTTLREISLIDGSLQAQIPLAADGSFDKVSGLIVQAGGSGSAASVTVVDPRTGQLLRTLKEDCGGGVCGFYASASVSSDDTLRVVTSTFDPFVGVRFRVEAFAGASIPVPTVRIDQDGLDGAWYAAYESGQGFAFDYIAGNSTVFMPWFTYGAFGGNDPAKLAWYALQGTVTSAATHADLLIYQTDPGNFNSGTVGGHAVGTAQLSFSDCNNGQLSYRFDPDTNLGRRGVISLMRLSPSTASCTLADGTTAPAQIANPPTNGFDARQSGSWFDPSTSGQGIELAVIPSGPGFPGLAFAAWFTFDPVGMADDPAHEHWFTLQGDLSAAVNGSVTLPIISTIGGTFDDTPTSDSVQVGHATLSMQRCDKAQLTYQFDQAEDAHAFSGLAGSMNLVKIGGCAPQ